MRDNAVGLALSGGGSRAMVSALGQLRALTQLGWSKELWGISAASGGAWAAIPYCYLPDLIDEAAFLGGPALPPERLRWLGANLRRLPTASLGRAAGRMGVARLAVEALRWHESHHVSLEQLWCRLVGEILLAPYGLAGVSAAGRTISGFSWDQESLARDIEDLNPDQPALAPAHFHLPQRRRPFLIVNTALVPRRGHAALRPYEVTPLSAGVCSRDAAYPGSAVSPFLVGSRDAQSAGDNLVSCAAPQQPFALSEAAGVSSVAFAEAVQLQHPRLDRILPRLPYWSEPGEPALDHLFADGGSLENTGVIALLRRPLRRVLACINAETPLQPLTGEDILRVDQSLPPLFGLRPWQPGQGYRPWPAAPDPDGAIEAMRHNQVFPTGRWAELLDGLRTAIAGGGCALLWQRELPVLGNAWFGVAAGGPVDVLWVYNHMPNDWYTALPWSVRLGMRLSPWNYKDFPHYATVEQMHLAPRQVNLLAQLASANLLQAASAALLERFFAPRH